MSIIASLNLLFLLTSAAVSGAPFQAEQRQTTVGDIVKLVQSGIGEDVIVAKLQKEGRVFDLSTDDLISLKTAGASSAVLKAMMNPGVAKPAVPAAVAAAGAATDIPDEQGVYIKIRGEWKLIEPQVVNMRTANVLGHAFSYGIAKAKLKGDVAGPKSKTPLPSPVELLIKAAEGTSANEYQVLLMEPKGDRREFEALQIGFASAKSGARKGVIDVKFEKIGKAMYTGKMTDIKPGEYGVLPPGAALSANTASSGKMYCFTVIE